jgi:hypothetical protein
MISINARPSYWEKNCMHRISTIVRGHEIADYLGLKFNERDDDPCIWIKPRHLRGVRDGDWVDVLDDLEVIPHLKERPSINVIAMSEVHYEYLKNHLPNKVILIYHHHINIENVERERNEKLVGGIIGSPSPVALKLIDDIKNALFKIDVAFTASLNDHKNRQEMVDYYKSIDFLVIFNLNNEDRNCWYRHPTKILNAASFGIPSLAQPIAGYREVSGLYRPVETIEDIVKEANKLKDNKYYEEFSNKLYAEAEKYHISQTTKGYDSIILSAGFQGGMDSTVIRDF